MSGRSLRFLVFAAWGLCATGAARALPGTTTLPATADTWLDQDSRHDNHGTDNPLRVVTDPGNSEIALLRFDLSGIAADEMVTAATLRIKVDSPDPDAVHVMRMAASWTEGGATWSNAAHHVDTTRTWATFTPSASNLMSIDVTALVQALATSQPDFGIALVASGNGESRYDSRETGAVPQRPTLDVTTASDAFAVDVGIATVVDRATAAPGDTLVYSVTATNFGQAAAILLTIGDTVPANTAFVSATATKGSYASALGTWTVGSLAGGETATLTLGVRLLPGSAGTRVTNEAFVWTSIPADAADGNDSASAFTDVAPDGAVDLAVTKIVDNALPAAGQTVQFLVTLSNAGTDATGVAVADSIPPGLSHAWSTPSAGTYDPLTGRWQVGALGANTSATLTIAATVDPGTEGRTIVNRAALSAVDQPEVDGANDADSASVTVISADLAVTAVPDVPNPREGDPVTIAITVHNGGPTAATGVAIDVALPSGLSFRSATPSAGSYDSGSGRWTLGALANGATGSLEVIVDVDAGTGGATLEAHAGVGASDQPDPDPVNDSAIASVTVQSADVGVAIAVDDATPREGDTIHLLVHASGSGPNDAGGVQIRTVVPAGLTALGGVASHGTWNSGSGLWDLGTLAAHTSDSLSIDALVGAGAAGRKLVASASVLASDLPDPVAANDADSVEVAAQSADLSVTKTPSVPRASEGDAVLWTVVVRNDGDSDAAAVRVLDPLPAGLTHTNHSASHGTYDPGTGLWDVGALAASTAASLAIVTTVDAGTAGTDLTNTATSLGSDLPDPDPADDSWSADLHVRGADLRVGKTVNRPAPPVGTTVTYTVTVTNAGPDSAFALAVADSLPSGITYASHATTAGTYDPPSGIWSIPQLADGTMATLTLLGTVDAGAQGATLVNRARVASASPADPVPGNEADSALVSVPGIVVLESADVALSQSVSDAAPREGDPVTITLDIVNHGPDTAGAVEVTDLLPAGLVFSAASASKGTYAAGTGIWTIGDLAPDETADLTIDVTAGAGTAGDAIVNTASVSASDLPDPVAGNNTAPRTITVQAADLALAASATDVTPDEGDTLRITVTVDNAGPDGAGAVAVASPLPAGLTFLAASPDRGSYTPGSGQWLVGAVGSGESVSLAIDASVDAGTATRTITPLASIAASDQGDPVAGNDSASVALTVRGADLSLAKSADDTAPDEGQRVQFTVDVANAGPDAANAIVVSDLLPEGLTFAGATASAGSYDGGTGEWTVGTLGVAAGAQLLLEADVDAGTGGAAFTNTAIVTSATGDTDASNDSASVTLLVNDVVGISVAAFQSAGTASPGATGKALFTAVLSNSGDSNAILRSLALGNRTAGSGTVAQLDAEFGPVFLYRDDGDLVFEPAADVVLASGTFSAGILSFAAFNSPIAPGATRAYHVGGGPSLAAKDGDVLDLAIEGPGDLGFQSPQTFVTGFPVDPAGGLTVDGMVSAQCAVTTLSNASVLQGSQGTLALQMRLPANGYSADALSGLRLVNAGTAVAGTDVSAVKLWVDGGDGAWGSGGGDDTLAGSTGGSGSTWTFTGLAAGVPAGGRTVFATVDVPPSATAGRTVTLRVPAPDGITVASANDGPLDATLSPSRTLTIAAATGGVVVTASQDGAALFPGDDRTPVFSFIVRNESVRAETLLTVEARNLATGSASATQVQLDADWQPLVLVRDRSFGSSGSGLAGDPAPASFSGGLVKFTLSERIAAGDSALFRVESGASLSARDADLLDLDLPSGALGFTAGDVGVTGLPAGATGDFPVDGMSAAQIAQHPIAGGLSTGDVRRPVMDVVLPANGYEADKLLRFDVTNAGTATPADLDRVELWVDDGDGSFDAGADRVAGALAYTGGRWEITGLSEDVVPGAGLHLFVTVDVSDVATPGRTVRFVLSGPPDPGVGMLSANDGPVDRDSSGEAFTIGTVDRVTLSAPALVSRAVAPGATGVPLLQIVAANSYTDSRTLAELRVHNITTGPGTQAQRDAQFTRLLLWADDGDGTPEGAAGDTLLAVSFFDDGVATFGGLHAEVAPGQSRRLHVLADLSVAFAADGDMVAADVAADTDVSFATPTAVAAGWPLDSGARHPVDGMVAAQITRLDPPAVTIGPDEGPVAALGVVIPGRGYDGDRLTSLTVGNLGTAAPGDIASIRLWRDGGNGAFDAGAGSGDDSDLGILAQFGGRWTHPALAETLLAGGSRFWVSARSSATPADSATIRLSVPVGGLVVASGNDGPIDTAVSSANAITLSTSVLLASLAIRPQASTLDSTVSVTMVVRNVDPAIPMVNVTPSALVPEGPGLLTLLSGPVPAMLSLAPGAADSVSWTFRADGAGAVRLSGHVTGEESGTGTPHRSLDVLSDLHTVVLQARDLNVYAVESMPFSISRGQTGIVPISLTFENPAGSDGSDILVTRLRIRVEDESGTGVAPAALLSRVVVNEGAIVYCDRTALETTGAEADLPLAPALRVEPAGSAGQATVALAIDVSESTSVGSFRIQVVDAAAISAEDATSGGPVTVSLLDPPAFPVSSGLARVVGDAVRLDVAEAGGADGSAGRGQADVELLTLQLANTDPSGLAADVRVPSFAVQVADSTGAFVPDASAWLERIRVATGNVVHLERALGPEGPTVTLALSPLLSVPVNAPVTLHVTGTVAAAAPLGTMRLVLADTSRFVARDANTVAPVPVVYAVDPLAGRAVTIQEAVEALYARGAPRMPAAVAVGSKDVAALDVALSHPGGAGGAAVLVDSLALECRDAFGGPIVPSGVLDRIQVLRGTEEVGVVVAPPTSGSRVVIPLTAVGVAPGDTLTLTVRFDAELTAPATRMEVIVPGDGVAARDGNLGTPVAVTATGGSAFPLRSGLAQLLVPARELAVGFQDRMPAVLAADGSSLPVATLTLRNTAPVNAGPLLVSAVTLRAAGADLAELPLGSAVERIVLRRGGAVWAQADTVDAADAVARLAPADTLEIPAGSEVELLVELGLRRGTAMTSLRVGVTGADVEAVSGAGEFLGVSILAEPGQSLPFWTAAGNFGGTSLAESWSNFPNPFAAGREPTRFAFYLPRDGRVSLRVRSIRGDEVKLLLDGAPLAAGLHQDAAWDGRNGRGDVVRNGVYLAEIGVAYDDGTSEFLRRKVAVVR